MTQTLIIRAITQSLPFAASAEGIEARAESHVSFAQMQKLAAERLGQQRRDRRSDRPYMNKCSHSPISAHRKAVKRLNSRSLDFSNGSQAGRGDKQGDRWDTGGYHQPGSLQKNQ
jgi:hypothetical protein